jgi:hypothetical protein
MRRISNGLVVLCLAAVLSTPAQAAPRRDDGDTFLRNSIKKVVQLVKKVVRALDDSDISMSIPRP